MLSGPLCGQRIGFNFPWERDTFVTFATAVINLQCDVMVCSFISPDLKTPYDEHCGCIPLGLNNNLQLICQYEVIVTVFFTRYIPLNDTTFHVAVRRWNPQHWPYSYRYVYIFWRTHPHLVREKKRIESDWNIYVVNQVSSKHSQSKYFHCMIYLTKCGKKKTKENSDVITLTFTELDRRTLNLVNMCV